MRTLLRLAFIALNASACHTHIRPRADQPGVQDILDLESVSNDGPTSDRTAGLGVEFESLSKLLRNTDCSLVDTQASKGKIVAGRQGTNWKLTADTSENPGALSLEYVLDGTAIKIGTGAAADTGDAIAQDLVSPYQLHLTCSI
nr:hypothetical protein CFP56_50381 [Quercus suber]